MADRALGRHRQGTADVMDLGHVEAGHDPRDEPLAEHPGPLLTDAADRCIRPPGAVGLGDPQLDRQLLDRGRDRPTVPLDVGVRRLLAVVGDDPDVVLPAARSVRRAPQARDGAVDGAQRVEREPRVRPAPVRVLVVAEQVAVHHRQPSRQVDRHTEHRELAQHHADRDSRHQELQLRPAVLTRAEPGHEIPRRGQQLSAGQRGHADHRGQIGGRHQGRQPPTVPGQGVADRERRHAEASVGGLPRVHVGERGTPREQRAGRARRQRVPPPR